MQWHNVCYSIWRAQYSLCQGSSCLLGSCWDIHVYFVIESFCLDMIAKLIFRRFRVPEYILVIIIISYCDILSLHHPSGIILCVYDECKLDFFLFLSFPSLFICVCMYSAVHVCIICIVYNCVFVSVGPVIVLNILGTASACCISYPCMLPATSNML